MFNVFYCCAHIICKVCFNPRTSPRYEVVCIQAGAKSEMQIMSIKPGFPIIDSFAFEKEISIWLAESCKLVSIPAAYIQAVAKIETQVHVVDS